MSSVDSQIEVGRVIVAYSAFVIIFLGVVGNTSTFLTICFNKDLRKISSMIIICFVNITDTLALFTWNLDHYYSYKNGFNYETLTLFLCRTMSFVQYFSLQSSAILLAFVCLDRYVTVMSTPGSIYSRLPFSTTKTSIGWSLFILFVVAVINSHLLVLNGYLDPPQQVNQTATLNNQTFVTQTYIQSANTHCYVYKDGFKVYPVWDIVHMFIYFLVPGAMMLIFNVLLIIKTSHSINHKNRSLKASKQELIAFKKKRRISVSLIIMTSLFFVLSAPTTIFYGYISPIVVTVPDGTYRWLGYLFDTINFFNQCTAFLFQYMTNVIFRRAVKANLSQLFQRLFNVNIMKQQNIESFTLSTLEKRI